MKRLKQALSLGLAGVMMTAAPVTALAASPEFSRSAEEWAKLTATIRLSMMRLRRPDSGIQCHGPDQQCHGLKQSSSARITATARMNGAYRIPGYWQMRFGIQHYATRTVDETDLWNDGDGSCGDRQRCRSKNMEQQADDNLQDSEIVYL